MVESVKKNHLKQIQVYRLGFILNFLTIHLTLSL